MPKSVRKTHPDDELAAAQAAIVVLRAELTREAAARAKAEKQAALAGELLGSWIQAYRLQNQQYQEALEERRAAEERAQAQAARDVDDAVTKLAAADAMALRDAAENERARLAERLLAVENELADRRKAEADDASYLTGLLAADSIPDVITFFARRVLGVPFEDADQAFDALEQQSGQIAGDTRPQPEAEPDVGVQRHPLTWRYHRPPDGRLRTTRASVPDGESASRWEPGRKK